MKKKGISLIVLVITIVVIIILAAAIILSLGDNNPINNAKEAQKAQDFANIKTELEMYITNEYTNRLGDFDRNNFNVDKTSSPSILDVLPSIKGTKYEDSISIVNGNIVQKVNPGEEVYGVNATVTGKAFAYNNPVIPVGFKTLETTKATWKDNDNNGTPDGWNEGLVILDENDNEYVWIPVYGEIEYSKRDSNVHNNYTARVEEVKDDSLPVGIISEDEQISKYGGFYVARYEAGLPDSETTEELMKTKIFSADDNNKNNIGKAQSKENKIVWNRINYTNSKIVAEDVVSNEYVQSGLLTGTQWDTMCKFIEKSGVDVLSNSVAWGNYYDKIDYNVNDVYYRTEHADVVYSKGNYTKSANGYLLLPTGIFAKSVENSSPKNLYDVAGNVWEWTAEIVNEVKYEQQKVRVGNIILRAGSYHVIGANCAAFRHGNVNNSFTNQYVGFRFVLYVK